MNHKWQNNKCERCNLKREKKGCRTLIGVRSFLARTGIFDEAPMYRYDLAWAFSFDDGKWTFERPDCIKIEVNAAPKSGT